MARVAFFFGAVPCGALNSHLICAFHYALLILLEGYISPRRRDCIREWLRARKTERRGTQRASAVRGGRPPSARNFPYLYFLPYLAEEEEGEEKVEEEA